MRDDDVILWLLRRIVDAAPGLQSNDVIELEREARVTWGGRRTCIAKRGAQDGAYVVNRTRDVSR